MLQCKLESQRKLVEFTSAFDEIKRNETDKSRLHHQVCIFVMKTLCSTIKSLQLNKPTEAQSWLMCSGIQIPFRNGIEMKVAASLPLKLFYLFLYGNARVLTKWKIRATGKSRETARVKRKGKHSIWKESTEKLLNILDLSILNLNGRKRLKKTPRRSQYAKVRS